MTLTPFASNSCDRIKSLKGTVIDRLKADEIQYADLARQLLNFVAIQLRVPFVQGAAGAACSEVLKAVKGLPSGQLKFQKLYNQIKTMEHAMGYHLLHFPEFSAQATKEWASVARLGV